MLFCVIRQVRFIPSSVLMLIWTLVVESLGSMMQTRLPSSVQLCEFAMSSSPSGTLSFTSPR